jgi:hypothetical protein
MVLVIINLFARAAGLLFSLMAIFVVSLHRNRGKQLSHHPLYRIRGDLLAPNLNELPGWGIVDQKLL